ncbi:MAG: hypothetical protein JSV45_12085 [Chromatiales bacterium]|nr:MAG: hypothetical protein JSV45_12085 [Chromatiales bacterium]
MWRQLLMICACGSLSAGAWAKCESVDNEGCQDAFVYDGRTMRESLEPWLDFSAKLEPTPVVYPATGALDRLRADGGLSFDLRNVELLPAYLAQDNAIAVSAGSEPAFAVLFGSVARLRADGTMALGRGSARSNSPVRYAGYWDDLLPAAYYAWDDRLDVDLGLSYAGSGRFTTSVGFAEKIGEQNNDPAVVGWFEFRF